jgi:hypothetical protein
MIESYKIIYFTLFILAVFLAIALIQNMYFNACVITIFAVIFSKYIKDSKFREFIDKII